MKRIIMLGVFAFGCMTLASASAQDPTFTMLDFTSFMYESDNTPGATGFPPSAPGDMLALVGYIENIGSELDWDASEYQLTIVFSDLESTGEMDIGNGIYYIVYMGGSVDIVAQRWDAVDYTSPAYGVEPPNATAPAYFQDGEVWLHGDFYSFYMTYHPTLHVGSFEGYLNWTGGTQLNTLYTDPTGYTVAGTVDPLAAPVPDGYDLEADGHISFDAAIPVETDTWGGVKTLFR